MKEGHAGLYRLCDSLPEATSGENTYAGYFDVAVEAGGEGAYMTLNLAITHGTSLDLRTCFVVRPYDIGASEGLNV